MGRYIKGRAEEDLDIGTLASRTLVSDIFDNVVNERTYVSSADLIWSLDQMTTGNNIGPVMCGLAHSDYSDAEIEAVIENTGSWDEGDLIKQEINTRKIRIVGVFRNPQDNTDSWVLNDGRPIKTKLGWMLLQGQSLRLWAYNMGSAAFATTDPDMYAVGHVNLWPR